MRSEKRIFIAVMCASLLYTASAGALDFKGLKLGATENEVMKSRSYMHCENGDGVLSDRQCSAKSTLAGADAFIMLFFYNDRLYQVYASFEEDDFETVFSASLEKYGQPASKKNLTVENRMGAQFDNAVVRWIGEDEYVELTQRTGNISDSAMTYSSDAMDQEFARRKAASIKGRASDL